MGTNFYWHAKPPCETCGHVEDGLHIGKSSAGWCFSLHVDPSNGINTLGDWMERFKCSGSYIRDEYGHAVTVEDMLKTITERRGRPWEDREHQRQRGLGWALGGYRDEDEFHARNDSLRGPEGLLRHRIGRYCVGHGESTYDLIPGEFS